MRTAGILDGGRRRASLGSSTASGGAPPWVAPRRAEGRLPGQLDGGRRHASLCGSMAGTGGLLAHGNQTSAPEGDGCARKAGWRTAGSRQRSLPAFPGWRRRNRSHKFRFRVSVGNEFLPPFLLFLPLQIDLHKLLELPYG